MTPLAKIQDFLRLESAAGVILAFAAALAIIIKNSPLAPLYDGFVGAPVSVAIGAFELSKPAHLWINDALMAVFFLLVALEIKREVVEGELSGRDKAVLPIIAALGGVAVPAAIFAAVNIGDPLALKGWAVPSATDIAFALGVLSLLGDKVPTSLKVFLLAIAIIDDLAAIIIIAAFYTSDLSTGALALAAPGILALALLNRMGCRRAGPYLLVGLFVWACVLKSGVHATLAGVIVGLSIPLRTSGKTGKSPLHELEHGLHPYVAYLILPLFAFANAGLSLAGLSVSDLLAPIPLGIALGLLIGKPLGVFAFTYVAVRLGLANRPEGASWLQVLGVGAMAGIGFTMSLFIGELAFVESPEAHDAVRLGVLLGSLASAVAGYMIFTMASAGSTRAPGTADKRT